MTFNLTFKLLLKMSQQILCDFSHLTSMHLDFYYNNKDAKCCSPPGDCPNFYSENVRKHLTTQVFTFRSN